jgi:hypothetical protein
LNCRDYVQGYLRMLRRNQTLKQSSRARAVERCWEAPPQPPDLRVGKCVVVRMRRGHIKHVMATAASKPAAAVTAVPREPALNVNGFRRRLSDPGFVQSQTPVGIPLRAVTLALA